MNKELAIKILKQEIQCVSTDCGIEQKACIGCKFAMPSRDPIVEAYKIAIKALEESIRNENVQKEEVNPFEKIDAFQELFNEIFSKK